MGGYFGQTSSTLTSFEDHCNNFFLLYFVNNNHDHDVLQLQRQPFIGRRAFLPFDRHNVDRRIGERA